MIVLWIAGQQDPVYVKDIPVAWLKEWGDFGEETSEARGLEELQWLS